MDAEQVLAFRLARSGLTGRVDGRLADAAACPASDFSRDAALFALAARHEGFTRDRYADAVDSGDLVVAHVVRGAIHALAPEDFPLYGRALVAGDDDDLLGQLGEQVRRLAAENGFSPSVALQEVADATKDALRGGRALDKNQLHDALRERVAPHLMPWCRGCKSHHVAPMLWRYGVVKAGARLDAGRRYLIDALGGSAAPAEAARRFLGFYGPADARGFAEWAGLARDHAKRLWNELGDEIAEVAVGKRKAWALTEDLSDLDSPPDASGVRLLPPGDPYLQKPNRLLLTPEAELRKRMFRPVASPGAVLKDGRLVGLWRIRAKGKKVEITVETFGRVASGEIEDEARRLAELRGSGDHVLVVARA